MNLGVNTAIYNSNGVDVNNVDKVASQILESASKASEEVTVKSIDFSKFNRASLGIDLYSSRTNVDLQKQIALTQAGLYLKSVDVAKLNSAAAASLYSAQTVQKQVELTQSTQAAQELSAPKRLEENKNAIKLVNITDKNFNSSQGSNPFVISSEDTVNEDNNENETGSSLFV